MAEIDDDNNPETWGGVEAGATVPNLVRVQPPIVGKSTIAAATIASAIGGQTADLIAVTPIDSLPQGDLNSLSGEKGPKFVPQCVLIRLKHVLQDELPTSPPDLNYLARGVAGVIVDIKSSSPGRDIGVWARMVLEDLNLEVEGISPKQANGVLMNNLLKWGFPEHQALKFSMMEI